MIKPKLCPFCGGMPKYKRPSGFRFYDQNGSAKRGSLACDCGAAGPYVDTGYQPDFTIWRDKAIAAWNSRVTDETIVNTLPSNR